MRSPFIFSFRVLAGTAAANPFLVNSQASYLRAGGETPPNALAIDLAANGFLAAQTVILTRLGSYNDTPAATLAYGLSALFSGSNAILPSTSLNRVPGALAAGPTWASLNTLVGNHPTDIAQDFEVCNLAGTPNGVLITIPAGAQYLFTAAEDGYYADNNNAPELYLAIAPVPEPTGLVALGLGVTVVLRRRLPNARV